MDGEVRAEISMLVAEISAGAIARDGARARIAHALAIRRGLDRNIFVANALVNAYAKGGRIAAAIAVFQGMDRRDVVTWNTMMLGYVENGLEETGLEAFQCMIDEGCLPDERSFVAAIKACSKLAEKEQSRELDNGELVKLLSLDRAIAMYAKCGNLIDAKKTFDALEDRRVVSWTVLMLGYCDDDQADVALDLFREMQAEGCRPNPRTFLAAVKACSRLPDRAGVGSICLERVMAVHSRALASFPELDLQLCNALIDSYASCGSIRDARRVFDGIKTHSIVSWTSLLLGYVGNRQENLGLELMSAMPGDMIDPQMLVGVVKACTSLAIGEQVAEVGGKFVKVVSLERAMDLHSRAARFGYDSNTYLASALVDLYAKCGSMVDSRRIFDRIPRPGVVLWTALILGYTESRDQEQALDLFATMKLRCSRPNCQTYVAVLKATAAAGLIKTGMEIHAEVCRQGIEIEEVTANSLVDLYAKCGKMESSQHLFDSLPERSLISWNTLLVGYSHQGSIDLVFDSWHRMRNEGIHPNEISFVAVLSACSHAGFISKGTKFFAAMASEFGVVPGIEHYGCMADLFARADELRDALAMAAQGSSTAAWLSVLSACGKLKNIEIGETIFKSLLETRTGIDSTAAAAAAYDLMANVYSQR